MVELLTFRAPPTEEERAAKLREKNRANYERSKREMKTVVATIQGFVLAGRMTQDDADKTILTHLHGQYRVEYREKIARRKAEEEAAARLTEKETNQARQGLIVDQFEKVAANAVASARILALSFLPIEEVNSSNLKPILERTGFAWPDSPSPLAFYQVYSMVIPVGLWPSDGENAPDVKSAANSVNSFIHGDKITQLGYGAALGGEQKATEIHQIFLASTNEVKKYLANKRLKAEDKQEFLNQCWESAKYAALKAMRLNSTTLPPFFIAHSVDQAALRISKETREDGRQSRGEE